MLKDSAKYPTFYKVWTKAHEIAKRVEKHRYGATTIEKKPLLK